jgi:hypothetical protein
MTKQIVSVHIPLRFYVLAGHAPPTEEQTCSFTTRRWYGGALDGLATQMPNVVDWSRSVVDLSPLVPWLGKPDPLWARKLAKKPPARWPELRGRLDAIEIGAEVIGDGDAWGDPYPI